MPMQSRSAEAERIMLSLSRVGPNKPIGYLPLYTLRDVVKVDPESVMADAMINGLAAVAFGPEECCIKSGALYIYDAVALSKLLQARANLVVAEGIPIDPDKFVAYAAAVWLEETHPAYPVIAAAFGEVA